MVQNQSTPEAQATDLDPPALASRLLQVGAHHEADLDPPASDSHFQGDAHHVTEVIGGPVSHLHRGVHQAPESAEVIGGPVSHLHRGVHQAPQSVLTASVRHPTEGGAHQTIASSQNHVKDKCQVIEPEGNDSVIYGFHSINTIPDNTHALDPNAASFNIRDSSLVHHGKLQPDLEEDWEQVQQVQAGGVGHVVGGKAVDLWRKTNARASRPTTVKSLVQHGQILPFQLHEDIQEVLGLAPKQIYRVNTLADLPVKMPGGIFTDKALPAPVYTLKVNETFTGNYYIALHNVTAAPGIREDGSSYPAYTPNHIGARVKLPHVALHIDRWRYHLTGYEDMEIIQFLEYGFPLGLSPLPDLESSVRNHGSSYQWYDHVDKFICTELSEGGLSGPFERAPWWNTVVSPLMTAHKKVRSRRTVYDATFGEKSLNNSTPSDFYMGLPCKYTFPKIQDYKEMILTCGPGAWMWKRDLSRFFLQLPLDPTEYHRVAIVWRGFFFFFLGLAFGLRHSGLQGQKITDAVAWTLRRLGREDSEGRPYQVCNYVDDLGGVEKTKKRATTAYTKLNSLLYDLGLNESLKKAEPPTTCITYLGVQFDSAKMTMSVPPDKITEIKAEIGIWARKTTITKKDLQSLLGKLFWVAKVVNHARPFMGRLLNQLRTMSSLKENKKVKLLDESKKDILWWSKYLEVFNGINMIVNEEPIPLSLEQLLDDPHGVCAGDATPTGGGAWHGQEYWCGNLPEHLQDTQVPIHIKEFWVLIVSAKLWGDTWTGRSIVLFCDNDSVCDTIVYKKPKDPSLLSLLREFLYVVVTKKFFPVLRKIGTKENVLADFISRRFDTEASAVLFGKFGLHNMVLVKPRANYFETTARW